MNPPDPAISALWLAATGCFGALVGGCELIGRYRDAPMQALCNPAAAFYIIVNALAAMSAYTLIVEFGWDFGVNNAAQAALVQAGVAGFGAMAFFRSSLFNVKVGDTEIAVGPAILFQILTFATDRAVDRIRGGARSKSIGSIMSGVSFSLARDVLPEFCFELMQNVPLEERENFRQRVGGLAALPTSDMTDGVKALRLGLMLMNVVGKGVLENAVKSLGARIQGASSLDFPVIVRLPRVVFEKAYPTLVDCCFVMSKYGTAEDQDKRKKIVMEEGQKLLNDKTLDNNTKVTMLALSLQQRVGATVLLRALAQLDTALYDRSEPNPISRQEVPAAPVEGLAAPNVLPLARTADQTPTPADPA